VPRDTETFQKHMVASWGQGKGSWEKRSEDGVELRVLSGERPLACLPLDRRLLCGESSRAVVAAFRRRPERSLWSHLKERPALLQSSVLLGGRGEQLSGLAGVTVERDGVSLELEVEGVPSGGSPRPWIPRGARGSSAPWTRRPRRCT